MELLTNESILEFLKSHAIFIVFTLSALRGLSKVTSWKWDSKVMNVVIETVNPYLPEKFQMKIISIPEKETTDEKK